MYTYFKWNKMLRCMVCLIIQHVHNEANEIMRTLGPAFHRLLAASLSPPASP